MMEKGQIFFVLGIIALIAVSAAHAVDTSAPSITLGAPANGTTNFYNTTNFTFTPLDDSRINSCTLYINDSIYAYTISVSNNTANNFSDILITDSGVYYWNISCVDNRTNAGNSGQAYFAVKIDKTAPTITLDTYTSTINKSGTATFYYTPIDMESGLSSCELIIDGVVNKTVTGPANNTQGSFAVSLPFGRYVWSVNCTDLNYNEGTSGPALTRETESTTPVITDISPANNTVFGTTIVNFSYIPSCSEDILSCKLIMNNSIIRLAIYPKLEMLNSFNGITLSDGGWRWSINCTSVSGKEAATSLYNLNISVLYFLTKYFEVKPNLPPDNYHDMSGSVTFTYIPFSTIPITNCELLINNSVRELSKEIKLSVANSFNSVDIGDGVWTWRIRCKNNIDQATSTKQRTLFVAKEISQPALVEAPLPAPLVETAEDRAALNETIPPTGAEVSKTAALIILLIVSVGFSFFIFFIVQPQYRKQFKSLFGMVRSMAKEQLKFYIDSQLRAGVSEERIRRHLEKYNWKVKDIDTAFVDIYSEMKAELEIKKRKK